MAGCVKADRRRKSPQGVAYKAQKRWETNRAKSMARAAAQRASDAVKTRNDDRGLTRALKRASMFPGKPVADVLARALVG